MTLVELIVGISIMLLISTLCFSKDDINKHYINSFTKQLCSDIRYVRKCNMLGDLSTYIYTKKDSDTVSYILRSNGEDVKKIEITNEIKVLNMDSILKFKKDGSPDSKGRTITIYNDKFKKEITIVPISGRVLLKEGKYET